MPVELGVHVTGGPGWVGVTLSTATYTLEGSYPWVMGVQYMLRVGVHHGCTLEVGTHIIIINI